MDGRGNAYVNGIGFDFMAGEEFAPGIIALVTPDGSARQVADGLAFPNGMARDARQLDADRRRVLRAAGSRPSTSRPTAASRTGGSGPTSTDGVPDGICLDAEGAVWYGDVPNKRCVRVREGGEVLQTIELDRGCFACALGGADRRTLFMVATEWGGPGEHVRGATNGPGAHRPGARTRGRVAIEKVGLASLLSGARARAGGRRP